MDEMIDTDFTRFGKSRTLRLMLSVLAIGMTLISVPAFADDEDDEPVRDRGIIGNIMSGMGATDGNDVIRYRERSPLVIPPKLTLPTPEKRRPEAANWPKDPDVLERRATQKAARERNKERENDPAYALDTRNNAPVGAARARTATVSAQPGARDEVGRNIGEGSGLLSPSQLQSKMDIFNIFGSSKAQEAAKSEFTGEPSRENLTQPPVGYQTPANAGQGYVSTSEGRRDVDRQNESGSGILAPGKF
jgi:hypothetical protein